MNRSCGNGRAVSSLLSLLFSPEARLSGGEKSVKRGEGQCKIMTILFQHNSTVVASSSEAGLLGPRYRFAAASFATPNDACPCTSFHSPFS